MLAGRLEVFNRVGDGFGQPGWRFSGTTTDGGFKCCRQRGEVSRGDGVAFIGVGTGHAQDGLKGIHPAHVTVAVGRSLGGPASGGSGGVGIGAQRITIKHQHAIGLVPLVIWTHGRAEHGGRGIDQVVETHWFKSHPARAGEFCQEGFLGRLGGGTRHRRGDHRNFVGRNSGQVGGAERVEGRPIGWGAILQNRSAAIDVVQIKQGRLGERVGATAVERFVAFELDRTAVHRRRDHGNTAAREFPSRGVVLSFTRDATFGTVGVRRDFLDRPTATSAQADPSQSKGSAHDLQEGPAVVGHQFRSTLGKLPVHVLAELVGVRNVTQRTPVGGPPRFGPLNRSARCGVVFVGVGVNHRWHVLQSCEGFTANWSRIRSW